jgi:hypothetical protein
MDDNLIIGEREVWGSRLPFGLSREDRRHHLYLIGQTGTGKSTLIRALIAQDILRGEGCALLDPHGDLKESVVDLIPSHRIDDVVMIEPSDLAHPVAWNPFFRVPMDERPLVASNLTAAFKHLWRDSWGPRLEYLLYNCLAATLDAPDHLRPTILSVPRMLVDDLYRHAIVASVRDPQVKQFWTGEFALWSERFLAEVISPVQNKIGAVVSAPSLRNILGQWRPTVDLHRIMRERKILLVNLSKGQLGEDKANLFGSLIVAGFQAAAMQRAAEPEESRRDFHLYIDEFHNFGTDAFASILSEARKFRLTLVLAHQYLAQLSDEVRDAVLGNVGSIACFRVGAGDAIALAKELSEYSPATLRSLARGEVCVRLLRNGEAGQPFLGTTQPPKSVQRSNRGTVISQVRQRYSHKRADVERRISKWLTPLDNNPS